MSFSDRILSWYSSNKRALPWRETRNPYVIWLSEIILQQTRVEQGLPYFLRFLETFPNVTKFAQADQSEILRLWQGLGYYSRARNMHKTSQIVLQKYNGVFPSDYQELLSLAGIGEYTAAAIASFSSNAPHAVLDGNVYRVLSRYLGIEVPINTAPAKKVFSAMASELLSREHPAEYNQAIMDFGSQQCKPRNPNCKDCVLVLDCYAYNHGRVADLPIKLKGKKSKDRYFHYFIIEEQERIMMSERSQKDVWANLFEFPMIETQGQLDVLGLMQTDEFKTHFGQVMPQPIGVLRKHLLSHQNIYAQFYRLNLRENQIAKKSHWNYYLSENLDTLAKHKLISSFVEEYF